MMSEMLEAYESGYFRRFAARLGVYANDIDDICQDAALKCCTRRSHCEPGRTRAYVRRVIVTCAADYYRDRRLLGTHQLPGDGVQADDSCSPEKTVDARLDTDLLLRQLPGKEQSAVRAHHLDGLSFREFSAIMGGSEQAARQYASRGIRALRARYR
jgi:RNA polymerase sigma factor (sigma-70 family)